jgi:hypothetical protein
VVLDAKQKEEYDKKWEVRWTKGQTQWDQERGAPILEYYVETVYKNCSTIKRAIVPGCGRGRDVLTLCQIPSVQEVIGIDLAPTALQVATELIQEESKKNPNIKKAKILLQDFFALPNDEKFDLAFDYTFLCALSPQMRESWAQKYAQLISHGGEIFTLIFPLHSPSDMSISTEGGPPFVISFEMVKELLEKNGFVNIEQRECDQSHKTRQGNEWIARWKKQ